MTSLLLHRFHLATFNSKKTQIKHTEQNSTTPRQSFRSETNLTSNELSRPSLEQLWQMYENNSADSAQVLDDDLYCETEGDWVSFGNQTYFKKSAAYYLLDLHFIFLNYLHPKGLNSSNFVFNLTINIQIYNKHEFTLSTTLNAYEIFTIWTWTQTFETQTVKIDFNLGETIKSELGYVGEIDTNSVRLRLQAHDATTNETWRVPIELKLKHSPHFSETSKNKNASESKIANSSSRSSGILVCSKVIIIAWAESEFVNIQLWTHLNRVLGYDKVVVYNLPGFKLNKQEWMFFEKNKDFVDFRQMKCIPNMLNSSVDSRYFRNLEKNDVNLMYNSIDAVNFILLNECFLDYFGDFK